MKTLLTSRCINQWGADQSIKEAQNRPSDSEMQKQMELQKLQGQLAELQATLATQ